jgi:hypothetical protein
MVDGVVISNGGSKKGVRSTGVTRERFSGDAESVLGKEKERKTMDTKD